MRISKLFVIVILLASCSINEELKPYENNVNNVKESEKLVAKRKLDCIDNCSLDIAFSSSIVPNASNVLFPQVIFSWSYEANSTIFLNPNLWITHAKIEFRAINGLTTCGGDIVNYTENFEMDITDEFLMFSTGQIIVDVAKGNFAIISDFELPNKIYEYRLKFTAEDGQFSCCYDTDWECFSVT